MPDIKTTYGRLNGVTDQATFCRGKIKSCNFEEINEIHTAYGTLVPQYHEIPKGGRQKNVKNAMNFYDNGQLKNIALEDVTAIRTSVGDIEAELVTFYREGTLKEVYPLNGKIDAHWSETDESGMVKPLTLQLTFGQLTARVHTLVFYPGGQLKNVVLWQGETLVAEVSGEKIHIRHGFALYEDGRLRSLEPDEPTTIHTSIGDFLAYDPEAQRGYKESYSLTFGKDGQLESLITHRTGIEVHRPNQPSVRYEPHWYDVPSDEAADEFNTLGIKFQENQLLIDDGYDQYVYDLDACHFNCSFLSTK